MNNDNDLTKNEPQPEELPKDCKPTKKKKKKPKARETLESLKRKRKEAREKAGRVWRNNWAGKTEEQKLAWVAKIQAGIQKSGRAGRPGGLPNGWTKDQWDFHCLSIKWTSKRYVEDIIKENELDRNNPDDQYAIEALEMLVNIMRRDVPLKEKLQATKTILEFTKAKPSTKSEVTLNSAEDFLANVLKDEENKKG